MMQGAHIFVQGRLHGVTARLDGLVARTGAKLCRRLSSAVTHTVVAHAIAPEFARRRVAGTTLSELAFKRLLGLAPPPPVQGRMFAKADVVRLSGLAEDLVDRLILFDILDPVEERFCFKDIASAREVARLLQHGSSQESIIAAGARLRDRGLRVSEARLQGVPWGGLMVGFDAQVTTLDGQFAFDLGDVAPQADELHARARVHADAGDWREAERLYRLLCRIDRSDPTYPFDLGNVLLNEKLYDAAILAFVEAFQRDPTSADPVYNIARIKAERGETQAAIASYREALTIEPDHALARFNLALLLTNARRFAEALHLWTAIVQSESDDKALARKAALLCRLEMRSGPGQRQ